MSSSKNKKPVVVLTFANEFTPHGFLRKLTLEMKSILEVLEPAIQKDHCFVKIIPSVSQREIAKVFQEEWYQGRIWIFHYGGHADEDELWLEDGTGENKSFFSMGLSRFLGVQEGLKLVFLNACATYDHAKLLMEAGIHAVVATSRKISDEQATRFARIFYAGLAGGASITESFQEAEGMILGEWGDQWSHGDDATRSLYWDDRVPGKTEFPWKLFVREGSETFVQLWRLIYELEKEQLSGTFEVEDLIGHRITNYEINKILGQGRFGIVYKAIHTNLNREVAIKVSHEVLEGYEQLKNVIYSGNKGLSTLKHPNVVAFYDAGEMEVMGQKRIYVVMEMVNGERLDKMDLGIPFMNKSQIQDLVKMVIAITTGLYAAHNTKFIDASGMPIEGFVHGNLKPRKIIFTSEGIPKIIDFLFTDLARSPMIKMDLPETVLNYYKGERLEDYYPPEVINGTATLNKQTDIFSLGAVFLEVIMSKKLSQVKFSSGEELEDLFKRRNKMLPKNLSKVIYKATHPNSAKRYQRVDEMIDDLMKSTSYLERLTYRLRRKFADF